MATATFGGTYTANGRQDYASGTVDLAPYGGSTTTVTLDGSGTYSASITLVLTSTTGLWLNDAGVVVTSRPAAGSQLIAPGGTVSRGWVSVTENLDGVPAKSYVLRATDGQVLDTGRDVGTVLAGTSGGAVASVNGRSGAVDGVVDVGGHATNSIPAAAGSSSLADLAVPASTFVARLAAGNLRAATAAEAKALLDVGQGDVSGLPAALATKALATDLAAETTARSLGDSTLVANTQTGNYTTVLADAGKAVEYNSASPGNVTIPPNASVPYPTGTIMEFPQIGAGAATLVPGAAVTITGDTVTPGQGGSLLLRKTGTNAWWGSITSFRSGTFVEYVRGVGIDPTGSSDNTSAMHDLILSTSAAAVAAGRIDELRWRPGVYLIDGLPAAPNVHFNFGGAVFRKRVDGSNPTNNSMFRAVPVPTLLVSTVTTKALTSNVATLTLLAPHDYVPGSIVVVAGVDATFNGTVTVASTPSTTTFTYAKTASNVGSTSASGTATRTSYYGAYDDMRVTGGTFDPNGHTCPAHVVSLPYTRGLLIDGTTVIHDPANLTWAFCVGGRDGTVRNCRVKNGTQVFQDGIHLLHGQHWKIHDNNIEAGDDALPFGGEPTDPYLSVDPDPIRHVLATTNNVKSERGFATKPYVQSAGNGPLWECTDITVDGLTGYAGRLRNGGLAFLGHQDSISGTNMLKRISVTGVDLDVGSTDHDDTNAFGAWIESVDGLDLSGDVRFPGEGTVGFSLAVSRNSRDVTADKFHCDAAPKRFGWDVRSTARFSLLNSRVKHAAGNTVSLSPVYLDGATDAKVTGNEITNIRNGVGCIAVVASTTGTTNGIILGNTCSHVAGASGGDGVQLVAAAATHLTLAVNDFTSAFRGADPSVLRAMASAIVLGNKGLADIPLNAALALVKNVTGQLNATAAQTMTLSSSGVAAAAAGSQGALAAFYINPADWPGGVSVFLRLRGVITTNATAPTSTFTFGLYPVTASAGGASAASLTLGAVLAGSSTTAVTAPPANNAGGTPVESAEFACPAAGFYVVGVSITTSMAASSAVAASATLLSRVA